MVNLAGHHVDRAAAPLLARKGSKGMHRTRRKRSRPCSWGGWSKRGVELGLLSLLATTTTTRMDFFTVSTTCYCCAHGWVGTPPPVVPYSISTPRMSLGRRGAAAVVVDSPPSLSHAGWAKCNGTPLADALLTEALRLSPRQLHLIWEKGRISIEALEVRLRSEAEKQTARAKEDATEAVWGVVSALREELDIGGEGLRALMIKNSWLLLMDKLDILANVKEMREGAGLTDQQIKELVKRQPQVLRMKNYVIRRIGVLVRELGVVRGADLATILKRHPLLLQQGFEKNLVPLTNYLEKDLGLSQHRIRRMVIAQPSLLTLSATGALRAKVEYFIQDLGLEAEEVATMVCRHPSILSLSLEDKIKPVISWLMAPQPPSRSTSPTTATRSGSESEEKEQEERRIESQAWGLGLVAEDVRKVISKQGDILGKSLERKLQPTAKFFVDSVGLLPHEVAHSVTKQPQLLSLSISHHLELVSFLKNEIGVDQVQIKSIFRSQPSVLTLSTNSNIRPKVALFREDMGASEYDVARLIGSCPRVLSASVQNRILPRFSRLRHLGVQPDISHVRMICTYSEERFQKWLARVVQGKFTPSSPASSATAHLGATPRGSTVTVDDITYISNPHRAQLPFEPGRSDILRTVTELAPRQRVLILRCGTGGFSIAAAKSGAATVTAVDSRRWAAAATTINASLNGAEDIVDAISQDVLTFLDCSQTSSPQGAWDLVVLDAGRTAPQGRQRHGTLVAKAATSVASGGILVVVSHGRAWKKSEDLSNHVEAAAAEEKQCRATVLSVKCTSSHLVADSELVRGVICSIDRPMA